MFVVYGKPYCPSCDNAKRLLDHRKIDYVYKDVTISESDFQLIKSLGYQTFPQVFDENGNNIGGFEMLRDHLRGAA